MLKHLTLTNIKLGINYLKRNGILEFYRQLLIYTSSSRSNYKYFTKQTELNKKEIQRQANYNFRYAPLYGFIYTSNKDVPATFIEAVAKQTYSNLILFFPKQLESSIDIPNQKIFFYSSIEDIFHIDCAYYIFVNENCIPAQDLLYEISFTLNQELVDIIYFDEDVLQNNKLCNPHFKPDFNYYLLLQYNYIGNCFCISKSTAEKTFSICNSSIHSLLYETIIFAKHNAYSVKHICKVLNHNLNNHPKTDLDLYAKILHFYFDYCKIPATLSKTEKGVLRVHFDLKSEPLVSIIIPNKDHIADLNKCINSIRNSTYKNYEIIIVENNSQNDDTFAYYKKVQNSQIRILYWNNEFNYSSINNFAVQNSNGSYLLFLNNDTEIITQNWIEEMLMYCQQDDVGITGALLCYPDYTVQHAGVILGIQGIAGHAHKNLSVNENGYYNRLHLAQEYSCVTAACMMIKRELFNEINGFDENFKVAFNDIDLCLKVRNKNLSIIYTPYAQLLHYESKSRGAENTPEKMKRFRSEIDLFRKKWHKILKEGDPYYNPNLTLLYEDFSLKRKIEYQPDFSFYSHKNEQK